jgi:hypothetical protein
MSTMLEVEVRDVWRLVTDWPGGVSGAADSDEKTQTKDG